MSGLFRVERIEDPYEHWWEFAVMCGDEPIAVLWNAGIADDLCRLLNKGQAPAASARAADLARKPLGAR